MNQLVREFILRASVVLLLPAPAVGQYMYLDTDGDSSHTAADVLQPTGATTIDVWLRTDSFRDGSPASCDTGDGPLSIGGYEFILHASNGTVTWGSFTNQITGFTSGIDSTSNNVDFHSAASGGFLPPGSYHLATIQVAVNSGTPDITIVPQTQMGPFLTGFASQCSGLDFSNTLTLGVDWFDVDGIPYGGVANHAPVLDPVPDLVVLEGTTLEQPLTAHDADGDPVQFTKRSGPGFMTVSTSEPGAGLATGLVRLAPGFKDAGTTPAKVEVSDGLASGLAEFLITVLDQNRPPTLEQPQDMTAFVRANTSQDLHASDPDGDYLEFTLLSGPTFASVFTVNPFSPYLGHLELTPDDDDIGDTDATVAVSDGTLSAERTLTIHVVGAEAFVPLICRPYDMTVLAGSEAEQVLMATTLGYVPLTFSMVSGPAFAQVTTLSTTETPQTGVLHLKPTATDIGEYSITVGVSDGQETGYAVLRVTVIDRVVPTVPTPERFTSTFRSYEVGLLPQAVVVTDLNEDGLPDLITPDQRCGITVLLGLGGGGFGPRFDYHLDGEPKGAAAADLDQDGHTDLVVATGIGAQLVILKGDGTGGLHPFSDLRAGINVAHVAVGDLNRDGIPDLVAAIEGENAIAVYAGIGAGTFAFPVRYTAGVRPCFTIIRDLNRDGTPDLSEASEGSDVASIYIGRGDGSFGAQTQLAVADGPTAVDAGDFDGDGNVDLVTPGFHTNVVSVLFGDGSGAFPRRVDFQSGQSPWSVCVADVNGDSRPDLITANTVDYNVSVLLGRAGGGFETQMTFPAGAIPRYVTCAELTGDHYPDLAVADETSAYVSILSGNGDGTFGTAKGLDAVQSAQDVEIADLNGDGRSDLVVDYPSDRALGFFRGLGEGAFAAPVRLELSGEPSYMRSGDVTGDGVPDLLVSHRDVGAVAVYRGGATFGADPPTLQLVGAGPHQTTIGDWNRDGRMDLAAACQTARSVTVLYGTGGGEFSGRVDLPLSAETFHIASGDWNGDGFADLAVNVGFSGISTFWGGGAGFTVGPAIVENGQGVSLGSGDLDGDGKAELIVCLTSGGSRRLDVPEGRISVFHWIGTDPLPVETVYPGGFFPGDPTIADVTNDGEADVVLAERGAGSVGILPGRGDRTLGTREGYGASLGPTALSVGDVDGDERLDVVTSDFQGRILTILRNLGHDSTPPLAARAFLQPDDRILRLQSAKPELCIQLEAVGGAFSLADVDATTLRMGREGSSVTPISAIPRKESSVADTDRNGVPELSACFAKEDLRHLFSDVQGVATVEIKITGLLYDRRRLEAALELTVAAAPGRSPLAARVSPNPMNPTATLTFTTPSEGPVRVTIFDVRGRAVARVFDSKSAPAGDHEIRLGGPAGRGAELASGVYFYRVETVEAAISGRFIVLK